MDDSTFIKRRAVAEIKKLNEEILIELQSKDILTELVQRKKLWSSVIKNPSKYHNISELVFGNNKVDKVVEYGFMEQEGLGLVYKLAQAGKTGEAIMYLEGCKKFFCFLLTENSSNLLIQTKDRIELALDKDCLRIDGGSNKTGKYNNNIFSVCPKDPTKLRGKVCMVIKNKVNLERMSVLQSEIDNHNVNNPHNQVHYKIIADEVDKTMTLTPNVINNSKLIQRIIDDSKVRGKKLNKHREYPRNINPFVDYCFNKKIHSGLVCVLGLTATTSDLYTNEGIREVFGNKIELSIKTNVLDAGVGHRDVSMWDQIVIDDEVGFDNSIDVIIRKIGTTFGNKYYTFLPAMMKNKTHIQVARQAHIIDPEILVISVNQNGVVGRVFCESNEFKIVNHSSKFEEETLAVKISDIVAKTGSTKLIVTGYISLCRGVTIQAKLDDLQRIGVKTGKSMLLGNGLVINCIGVHENIKVRKLGHNSDLIQRLCRGNGYPDTSYEPVISAKLIGCERVLKAFTAECNFITECMDEGKRTGFTTDTNFKKVKEVMEKVDDVEYDVDLDAIERRFKVWGNPDCYTKIGRLMKLVEPTKLYTRNEFNILSKSVDFTNASSAISMMSKSVEKGGYSPIFNIGKNTIKMNNDLVDMYNKYFNHT